MSEKVAALYVANGGCYFGMDGVDPWDMARDARLYAGPWPVIAHPPCARWGRYSDGGPQWRKDGNPPKITGDDDGCFESALTAVRRWGGVLEHPADSKAWKYFKLEAPPRSGGWVSAGDMQGWTCCVSQGNYGHRGNKATWLYVCRAQLPDLIWGPSAQRVNTDGMTPEQSKRAKRTGIVQRLSKKQREATPVEFRNLLISIARSVDPRMAQSEERYHQNKLS